MSCDFNMCARITLWMWNGTELLFSQCKYITYLPFASNCRVFVCLHHSYSNLMLLWSVDPNTLPTYQLKVIGYWPMDEVVDGATPDASDSQKDAVVKGATFLPSGGKFGVCCLVVSGVSTNSCEGCLPFQYQQSIFVCQPVCTHLPTCLCVWILRLRVGKDRR